LFYANKLPVEEEKSEDSLVQSFADDTTNGIGDDDFFFTLQ
jgi:hypothetical protein